MGSSAERKLLAPCRDTIRELVPGAEVILYGSRARGDADRESDYALLVLVDGPMDWKSEDRIRRHLYALELESGAVLTINAYNRSDWGPDLYPAMPFSQSVEEDGIIL